MNKLILYKGEDEVIVTVLEKEHETIRLYFTEGMRNLEEYERIECNHGYVSVQYGICTSVDCE